MTAEIQSYYVVHMTTNSMLLDCYTKEEVFLSCKKKKKCIVTNIMQDVQIHVCKCNVSHYNYIYIIQALMLPLNGTFIK